MFPHVARKHIHLPRTRLACERARARTRRNLPPVYRCLFGDGVRVVGAPECALLLFYQTLDVCRPVNPAGAPAASC